MCRGCKITIKGKPAVYEYLDWFDEYKLLQQKMKDLNKAIWTYEQRIDPPGKPMVSRFHKRLVKIRRELCRAEVILNEMYGKGEG